MNDAPTTPQPALSAVASTDTDWEDAGLCRQVDPDLWFPTEGDNPRDAKRICARCPVTDECLRWALDHDERFGVWGGLSARERRALTRHTQAAAS